MRRRDCYANLKRLSFAAQLATSVLANNNLGARRLGPTTPAFEQSYCSPPKTGTAPRDSRVGFMRELLRIVFSLRRSWRDPRGKSMIIRKRICTKMNWLMLVVGAIMPALLF